MLHLLRKDAAEFSGVHKSFRTTCRPTIKSFPKSAQHKLMYHLEIFYHAFASIQNNGSVSMAQSFSFCNHNAVCSHFRHSSICVETFLFYFKKLPRIVEKIVKVELHCRFAMASNGWTVGDTQYVSVFAAFPSNDPSGHQNLLYSLASLGDKNDLTAEEHFEFLKFVFSVYDYYFDNIVAWIGNNEYTDRAVVRRLGHIFVNCHSYRFTLAVRHPQ